jgi:hypothetical protein
MVLFGSGHQAKSEVTNGDGDVLWEKELNEHLNDAVFHPINGNIVAAVSHEIWEIDPKDGHTIRVFEGGYPEDITDAISQLKITSDGKTIITGGAMGMKGILFWDYSTGKVFKTICPNEIFNSNENIVISPDNKRIIFNSLQNIGGTEYNETYINVYDLELDSIIKRIILQNTYSQRFTISKDGKYIAFGISKGNPFDGFRNSLELWDAETLTKIRDFGEFKILYFRDIQISENNEYITIIGNPDQFSIFELNSGRLLKSKKIESASFINEGKYMIVNEYSPLNKFLVLNIVKLPEWDTLYTYNRTGGTIRTNSLSEIFSAGFDTIIGSKLQYFSNKWYEVVGVKDSSTEISGINSATFSNNYLTIYTQNLTLMNNLFITDTSGKKVYVQSEIPIINNQTEIPLALPSGNYLLKIISNGKEYTSKFIVVR